MDYFEVIVSDTQQELVFNDPVLELAFIEENFELALNTPDLEVSIDNDFIEILSVAEQGPPGVSAPWTMLTKITVSSSAPVNPQVGELWVDTN